MARKGRFEWYQWIGLIFLYISADFKIFLKDPGPLRNKNVVERINNSSWGVTGSWSVRG
jgi:hypothetical protein